MSPEILLVFIEVNLIIDIHYYNYIFNVIIKIKVNLHLGTIKRAR